MNLKQLTAMGALLCTSLSAQAGLITIGNTGVSSPDRVEDFEGVTAPFGGVSNEFSSSGLTFTTLSGAGIWLTSNSNCGNTTQGVTDNYLYMGLGGACSGNATIDGVSIQFDEDVAELSWSGFHRAGDPGFAIQALNDGSVVSNILFVSGNRFENMNVLFTGSVFDEIRFMENGVSSFFALDDMSWTLADGNGTVPIPATLALFGLGFAGLGWSRRKKA